MSNQEKLDAIEWFIDHDVSLDDIEEELDYRDRAYEGMKWNDSLYGYSDEDLVDIALLWVELNRGETRRWGRVLKSCGPIFETPLGDARLYACPHCAVQWLEFVYADEYPEYCPHCGEAFFDKEDT